MPLNDNIDPRPADLIQDQVSEERAADPNSAPEVGNLRKGTFFESPQNIAPPMPDGGFDLKGMVLGIIKDSVTINGASAQTSGSVLDFPVNPRLSAAELFMGMNQPAYSPPVAPAPPVVGQTQTPPTGGAGKAPEPPATGPAPPAQTPEQPSLSPPVIGTSPPAKYDPLPEDVIAAVADQRDLAAPHQPYITQTERHTEAATVQAEFKDMPSGRHGITPPDAEVIAPLPDLYSVDMYPNTADAGAAGGLAVETRSGSRSGLGNTSLPLYVRRADGLKKALAIVVVDDSVITEGSAGDDVVGSLPTTDKYYIAGGDEINFQWKTTKATDATVDVASGSVFTQAGFTENSGSALGLAVPNSGFAVCRITRNTTSRAITSVDIIFETTVSASISGYQYVPLAYITMVAGGITEITQIQFEELHIYEALVVSNGSFEMADLRMAGRNPYVV